jgi:hypothetical protein
VAKKGQESSGDAWKKPVEKSGASGDIRNKPKPPQRPAGGKK